MAGSVAPYQVMFLVQEKGREHSVSPYCAVGGVGRDKSICSDNI